jgi:hypothetical protein
MSDSSRSHTNPFARINKPSVRANIIFGCVMHKLSFWQEKTKFWKLLDSKTVGRNISIVWGLNNSEIFPIFFWANNSEAFKIPHRKIICVACDDEICFRFRSPCWRAFVTRVRMKWNERQCRQYFEVYFYWRIEKEDVLQWMRIK